MEKILLVDDEPNILQAYRRILRKDFNIYTAEGGKQGLAVLEEGEFAVIVSDMRMPEMNGIEFLTESQKMFPDTVRIMLTGDAGQQTAMDAVNEGKIYRFLTKPCSFDLLTGAIFAGLKQYRLIKAEKQLLEETLTKSLQVLIDILALINPTAFSRSTRVKRLAKELAFRLGIENMWEIEVAAMLSQIGCVTVPEEILQKINNCKQLSEPELRLYNQHVQVGYNLINRIPRMEDIAQIIAHQDIRFSDETESKLFSDKSRSNKLNSRIIKLVLDFDKLLDFGNTPQEAYKNLLSREGWYDPLLLETLEEIIGERIEEFLTIETDVSHLKPGMIFYEPLYSLDGKCFIEKGQEITFSLILRLNNFVEAGIIQNKFHVQTSVYSLDVDYTLMPVNKFSFKESENYLSA